MMFSRLTRPFLLTVGGGSVGVALFKWVRDEHVLTVSAKVRGQGHNSVLDPHRMNFDKSEWDWNWDRREPVDNGEVPEGGEDQGKKSPRATRHLLLIRHGQYNLKGETDDQRYLTPLGREQAVGTGERLAKLDLPLTRVIRSNMTRAVETADLILQSLPPSLPLSNPDPILREGAPVRPDPNVGHWHPEVAYFSDGARIEAAFRKYFHRADPEQEKDSYELVVCHANVIRYFVCRALQVNPEAWLRISLKHASITWVTIRPDGKVHVRCIGDAGHLKPEMLTTS